jgi:hypothetical protein
MIAQRTTRTLIVQTESGNPNLSHRFGQTFDSIFTFTDHTRHVSSGELPFVVNSAKSIYPEIYEDPSNLLKGSLSELSEGIVAQYVLPLSIDTQEDILVHESVGGGLLSSFLLGRIAVSEKIISAAAHAIARSPSDSTGLHFRNSDYKSNKSELVNFFSGPASGKSIVVATDDLKIKDYLAASFPSSKITFTRDLISKSHNLTPTEQAVAELLILGACKNLVLVPLAKSEPEKYSGYGMLAKQLWIVTKIKTEGLADFLMSLIKSGWIETRAFSGARARNPGKLNVQLIASQVINPRGVYYQLKELRGLIQKGESTSA